MNRWMPLGLLLTLPGCTHYDFLAGLVYQQATFNNDVDILFITDNSDSMNQPAGGENKALSDNFSAFMGTVVEAEETIEDMPHDDLGDAVAVSAYYAANFTRFIDYRVGMTTTDPTYRGGLVQDTVLTPDTEDIEETFSDLVTYVVEHTGGGDEQGLTALRLNICRGLSEEQRDNLAGESRPVGCTDMDPTEEGSTSDLYRREATLMVVLVSDEGDHSVADGVPNAEVDDYIDFFKDAGVDVVASVIGPTLKDENGEGVSCNPASSTYNAINRYSQLVEKTGGLLVPICNPQDPTAPNPDFASALGDIGALVSRLQSRFSLDYTPDISTLVAVVDGEVIPADPYNGWVYLEAGGGHFLEFRGASIPFYDARVEIYYRPIEEGPRDLPF